MGCNCRKSGGHMAPAPKPKDTSKDHLKDEKKVQETDKK